MNQDALYEGCRRAAFVVTKDGQALDVAPSRAVEDYSVGLSWAYVGQGPMQLAVALLLDACGETVARSCHRAYCLDVVANLSQSKPWAIRQSEVRAWVARHEAHQASGARAATGLAV